MFTRLHMSMTSASWLLLVVLVMSAVPVMAEQVEGLYDVAVPVSSQSTSELRNGSQVGLQTVFIRVSGDAKVTQNSAIQTAIRQANSFTKQFRYERHSNLEDGSEQLMLIVNFEPALVAKTLRHAGLPLWSNNRPSVLIWMVIEDTDGRRFVGVERDPAVVSIISAHAARRGVAIKLPVLDLDDMVAVSADEMWQLNHSRLIDAAARYQTDSVLFGRVSQLTNGNWLGRWRFDFNGERYDYDYEASSLDAYLGAVIDQTAQQMAAQYAVSLINTFSDGFLIRLTHINSFIDYARVIHYLESIAAIQHVNVVSIEGDEIIVHVIADGLIRQLQQTIALDQKLQASSSNAYQGQYLIDLDYQWMAVGVLEP